MSASRPPTSMSIQVSPDRLRPAAMLSPGGFIRLSIATEIVPLLREFGVDPDGAIRQAGLDSAVFGDENSTIPYAALGRLLTICVACTQCPHFGLLLGQRGTIATIGPMGGLLQHLPTVGDALSALVEHLHIHERGAAPTLSVSDGVVVLGHAIYEPSVESPDQLSDAALAVGMTIMRTLCGPAWAPDEVLLPRREPADPQPYQHFFQAPVRFDQEVAALVFSARWLGHRIAGANPIFREVFATRVRELEAAWEDGWKEGLRRTLRTEVLTNLCSATTVAARFAVHPRTLSRRLRAEGTGFQGLVDETRFEIARQLLAQTGTPLSQVAAALGYSEASAFTRAFRRWSGQSPSAWRANYVQIGKNAGHQARHL